MCSQKSRTARKRKKKSILDLLMGSQSADSKLQTKDAGMHSLSHMEMGFYGVRTQGVSQFWVLGPRDTNPQQLLLHGTAPHSLVWCFLLTSSALKLKKAQTGHLLYLPSRSDRAPSLERLKMCPTKSAFGIVNPVLQPCLLFPKTGSESVPEKSAPHLPSLLSWCWAHPSLKIQRKSVLLADLHLGQAYRSCLRQDCPVRLFLEMP